jgi:hypothetical protein
MVTGTSHDGALFVGDCSDGKFTPGEIRCSNCNEVLEDEIAKQGRRIWFATRCQTSVPIQLGFSWAPLRCTDGGIEVEKSSLEFANPPGSAPILGEEKWPSPKKRQTS